MDETMNQEDMMKAMMQSMQSMQQMQIDQQQERQRDREAMQELQHQLTDLQQKVTDLPQPPLQQSQSDDTTEQEIALQEAESEFVANRMGRELEIERSATR